MTPKPFSALALLAVLGSGAPAPAQEDPRALMLQARAMQRRAGGNDPKGAVAIYRKVTALVPNSAQAWLRLSEALLETGDAQGAVEPAQRATQLDPRSGEAWAHLGLLRYQLSNAGPKALAEAVETLSRAAQLLPGDVEVWTRLAELQDASRDEAGALKSWLNVGRLHPYHVLNGRLLYEIAFERALELAQKAKNYEARREAVLGLCSRQGADPRHLRLLEDLARDQVEKGFLGHGEESFTRLAQFVPKEPVLWENIALIQMRTSRFEAALATLARAEALKPTPRISSNSAYCLMKLGRFGEAEIRWKALAASGEKPDPEDPALAASIRVLYASCLLLEGRPKDLLDLTAGWKGTEAEGEIAALRAQALLQLAEWKAARAALRDGMKRFPKQALFRRAAGIPPKRFDEGLFSRSASRNALAQLDLEAMAALLSEFNAWERCLETVRKARAASPLAGVELMLLEANALENLDRPQEAMAVLREAQKLEPGNATLQNNLGYLILERGGDLEEAARLIEAALAKDPGNGSTMDSWGWALFKLGRYKEAEEALRKALAKTPYSPEVHRHLGETLLKLDRPQEALEEWERALAFVFPERRDLEKQVQDLKARLAKARRDKDRGTQAEPAAAEDAEDDEPEEPGETP